MKHFFNSLILSTVVLISACSSGGDNQSPSTGNLSLGMTDGPVENASQVVVTFSGVEVHGAENKEFTLDPAVSINLLDYQGENRALLLDGETLAAGTYQWIRLMVDEATSFIEINGQQYPLSIPSNAKTGLKLNRGFTIGADNSSDFTIDFDLKKSVHQTGNGVYKLRPTLRIVDSLNTSSITGTVDDSLIEAVACDNNGDNNDTGNSVYVFEGPNAAVQDIQGNENDPIASTNVKYNSESQLYEFVLAYMPVGEYTAAFTCDAVLDIADQDNSDVVDFSTSLEVSVVVDQNASIAFD
jgi:Domain of unknown function (DUF4382)